jgi:hypothetical protein
MPYTPRTSYRDQPAYRDAYFRFTPRVFNGVSFSAWYENGGWNEHYQVLGSLIPTMPRTGHYSRIMRIIGFRYLKFAAPLMMDMYFCTMPCQNPIRFAISSRLTP